MEKSKFLMVVIVILLILNIGTLALMFFLHRSGPPAHHPHKGPAGFIVKELEFDDAQQEKFEALKKEHQSQMEGIMDSIRMQREILPDLIVSHDEKMADSVSTLIGNYQKKAE